MAKRLAVVLGIVLLGCVTALTAQQYPFWEVMLHSAGKTDQTPVPSMKMGNHMQMSLKGAMQPGDEQQAHEIIAAARRVIARFADVDTAVQNGYRPFFPTGKIGEEVHYTNYRFACCTDYDHPRSILYKRTAKGMQAVGVMYVAPQEGTAEELNAIAPLSIATWHRHVDFCGAPRGLPLDEQFGPHAQFGFRGSIHTEEACNKAHGLWLPVVFGWMTHVYPDAKLPSQVWAGMEMPMEANADGAR